MFCGNCQVDVYPFQQFTVARGFISKCPTCNGGLVAPAEEAASADKGGASKRVEPQEVTAPVALAPVVPLKPALAPTDILGAARARLEMVREMIASLRQYEAEEAMLERMVAAADPPSAPRLALAR